MPESTPLRCRKCGGNKFSVLNHATNDSPVTCADCGDVIGRWGDFRIGILEEAKGQKIQKRAKAQKAT
jgi:DNA-directed RNA polymerase subunit N (RpoN/RPB10)